MVLAVRDDSNLCTPIKLHQRSLWVLDVLFLTLILKIIIYRVLISCSTIVRSHMPDPYAIGEKKKKNCLNTTINMMPNRTRIKLSNSYNVYSSDIDLAKDNIYIGMLGTCLPRILRTFSDIPGETAPPAGLIIRKLKSKIQYMFKNSRNQKFIWFYKNQIIIKLNKS